MQTTCPNDGGKLRYISNDVVQCEYCKCWFSTKESGIPEVNFEKTYDEAVRYQEDGVDNEDINNIKLAIGLYEQISDFRDSANRCEMCREALRELSEKIEMEMEKSRRHRLAGHCFALAICSVVAISIVVSVFQSRKYARAISLYEYYKYEDACLVFESLKNYKDSKQYVVQINEIIKQRDDACARGKIYYEAGKYIEAVETLINYSYYEEALEYINLSSDEMLKQAQINIAIENYDSACELLSAVPNKADSYNEAQILLLEATIKFEEQKRENDYESAVAYYEANYLDVAQKIFIGLDNYKDSRSYLQIIGDSIYKNAEEAYQQKDYNVVGEMLDKIDEASEWPLFEQAVSLFIKAKDEYLDSIKEDAKDVCRSDGYKAMSDFIDGKKCLLLTDSEYENLKQECTIEKVSLGELKAFAHDDSELLENFYTDTTGNRYSFALSGMSRMSANQMMHKGLYIASNYYKLSKEYKYLTGTVAICGYDDWDGDPTGYIEILGDDRIIYKNDSLIKTSVPYDIKVDVSDIDVLVIRMGCFNAYSYLHVMLGNPQLSE